MVTATFWIFDWTLVECETSTPEFWNARQNRPIRTNLTNTIITSFRVKIAHLRRLRRRFWVSPRTATETLCWPVGKRVTCVKTGWWWIAMSVLSNGLLSTGRNSVGWSPASVMLLVCAQITSPFCSCFSHVKNVYFFHGCKRRSQYHSSKISSAWSFFEWTYSSSLGSYRIACPWSRWYRINPRTPLCVTLHSNSLLGLRSFS